MIQKWQGHVEEVSGSTFNSTLFPILGDEKDDMYAEIYVKCVPERDRHMIVPGAMFYWRICEEQGSTIHFCRCKIRLPDLKSVQEEASKLNDALGWS